MAQESAFKRPRLTLPPTPRNSDAQEREEQGEALLDSIPVSWTLQLVSKARGIATQGGLSG